MYPLKISGQRGSCCLVFVLKWPGTLFPGRLCSMGESWETKYIISPRSNLLTEVMTRKQRQYNVPHKTMDFQKKSYKLIKRFPHIYKVIFIRLLHPASSFIFIYDMYETSIYLFFVYTYPQFITMRSLIFQTTRHN